MVVISNIIVGIVGIGAAVIGHVVYKHKTRGLKVGSDAASPKRMAHESWSAVAGTYVYIHNAFRNDLQRIITEDRFVMKDLERWADILSIHSRM